MDTTDHKTELDYLVRSLSHDMSANFMLLESSFSRLKKSLAPAADAAPSPQPAGEETLEQRVAHVEACLRESKRFLDDLVHLARTGTVEMEPQRVEVAAIVDDVLFEQRELFARRWIHVTVDRPLPVVWCNEGRVKQVVTNLVRNAARHGCDPDAPRIAIGPWTAVGQPPHAEQPMAGFAVHDNGPGIDRAYRREIFLPGRRLPSAAAEGSGMGLAIVKKIVDHYGGSIRVASGADNGTTFAVVLPAAVDRVSETLADPDGRAWKVQLDGGHRQRSRQPHRTTTSKTHRPS